MRITWSPLAIERVAEISAWIARDRPLAAERLVEEIFAAVDRLEQFAESGRHVEEIDQPDIREIIHGPYRIIYRIGDDLVEVLTVRHSRQLREEEDLER